MKVSFASPLLGASGYASDGRSLLYTLDLLNLKVHARRLLPDTEEIALEDPLKAILFACLSRSESRSSVNVVNRAFSEYPADLRDGINIRRITFETKRIPVSWVEGCNKYDQIWVPSAFNARGFIASGVSGEKIRVIPSPILDCDAAEITSRPHDRSAFRFLSIFRWQRRKGWDVLVRAFLEEFGAREKVELLLKVDPFILSGEGLDVSEMWRLANQLGYDPQPVGRSES
jgi:glycosyltransferase involved in cell wall biosynthesis